MKANSFFQVKTNQLYRLALNQIRKQGQEMRQDMQVPLILACAFALGTLTSFLPVPVLDSLLAVGLAVKFERLNKSAIFLARAVWNDLLVVPLYAPGFKVGQWLLGSLFAPETGPALLNPHLVWVISFLLGAAVLAILAASAGFLIVLLIAKMINSGKLALFKYQQIH